MRLNANHLAEGGASGLFEPQRANNGILVVDGLEDGDWSEDGTGSVALALESFPLPKESNTQIEARYMNERRKFAGPANVEDMEVVVKDLVDVNVALTLLQWRRLVFNPGDTTATDWVGMTRYAGPQGAVGLAKKYKKGGYIKLVAPDGTFERTWHVQGLWPMSMDPGDIDMTSEDFIRVSITLSVDRIWAANLVSSDPSESF